MASQDQNGDSLTPDEARQKLQRVSETLMYALKDVDRGHIYLSEQDATWLMEAFEAFLQNRAKSLDDAFGMKRGRGAPKSGPSSHDVMGLIEKAMWRGKKSWKDISDETGVDPRQLQRLVSRHGEAAIEKRANELVERMSAVEGRATERDPDNA